ncbi:zinc ribbon domain-containing protein [Okeania sp. SIO2B3]|nr:transposase [Okeania sp. SIO2B3]
MNIRQYECENCGFKADRDFNSAVNLENYAR